MLNPFQKRVENRSSAPAQRGQVIYVRSHSKLVRGQGSDMMSSGRHPPEDSVADFGAPDLCLQVLGAETGLLG